LESLVGSEQSKAIYLRLLRQEAMLSRILDDLERIQHRLSSKSDSKAPIIHDRKLRILRLILENNGEANISQIARLSRADEKTVRSDLNQLSHQGLILYMTGKKHCNPGRRGNCPRLTERGKKTAEAAFDIDREERCPRASPPPSRF